MEIWSHPCTLELFLSIVRDFEGFVGYWPVLGSWALFWTYSNLQYSYCLTLAIHNPVHFLLLAIFTCLPPQTPKPLYHEDPSPDNQVISNKTLACFAGRWLRRLRLKRPISTSHFVRLKACCLRPYPLSLGTLSPKFQNNTNILIYVLLESKNYRRDESWVLCISPSHLELWFGLSELPRIGFFACLWFFLSFFVSLFLSLVLEYWPRK